MRKVRLQLQAGEMQDRPTAADKPGSDRTVAPSNYSGV